MSETKSKLEFLKSQVQIRAATEADVPFIFNSWLKSFQGSHIVKPIPPPVYFNFHHKLIESLLQKCNVLVACSTTDDQQLYGYLICEFVENIPVIHYAYVKHAFRQMGVCKLLLASSLISERAEAFYTHETSTGLKLIRLKNYPMIYNPYLAYGLR